MIIPFLTTNPCNCFVETISKLQFPQLTLISNIMWLYLMTPVPSAPPYVVFVYTIVVGFAKLYDVSHNNCGKIPTNTINTEFLPVLAI